MNGKSSKIETMVSQLRKNAGWTQERLSERSGVPVRTIQRLEAGHETSLETLSRIADAFKVDVRDLFVTTDGDGFPAAVGGLDDRRARRRRRRWAWTIISGALIAVGVIVGIGGAWGRPGQIFAYAISGAVTVTTGLWLLPGRPPWVPIVAAWATMAVSLAYLLTFGWAWWVFGSAAAVVVGAGALSTWLLVTEQRRA